MRTRVKICGFTCADEALFAAQCGVDAIGLVFYPPSPRNVTIQQAQLIVKALPAFTTVVGLFVDAPPAWLATVLAQVPLDCLQFHGNELPEQCRSYGSRYIKAIRMQPDTDVAALAAAYHDANALLLDAYHPNIQGGTGSAFDWQLIPQQCDLPIILAGGLQRDNVAQALALKPYAIDVSSGVEHTKGRKDRQKITAFINAVHQGDNKNYDRYL